jgi:hypothetical protein
MRENNYKLCLNLLENAYQTLWFDEEVANGNLLKAYDIIGSIVNSKNIELKDISATISNITSALRSDDIKYKVKVLEEAIKKYKISGIDIYNLPENNNAKISRLNYYLNSVQDLLDSLMLEKRKEKEYVSLIRDVIENAIESNDPKEKSSLIQNVYKELSTEQFREIVNEFLKENKEAYKQN